MGGLKSALLFHIFTVLYCVVYSEPLTLCGRIPIHTTAPKTKGDGGFSIILKGHHSKHGYKPLETYKVVVKNTELGNKDSKFFGVMLVAVPRGAENETIPAGNFSKSSDTLEEDDSCEGSVIVHNYMYPKERVDIEWTAPAYGCVDFRATVISNDLTVWYKDDGGLNYTICPEGLQSLDDQILGDASVVSDTPECCACGEARYRMLFQGLWSKQTHPKDFPSGKHALMLHWSNIVGATHTEDYTIWKYGGTAKNGVKEVCEFGYSTKLEGYMKQHSDKIYTVIKTNAMWGNVLGKREAVFKVNQKAHLLSLLTMIGPSPDWCVGIPAMSMCNANCTWADEINVDLYPWDAGTDKGTTYVTERKTPEEEPQKIREITNTWPNHQDSPFYDRYRKVKPMARVTLTKLREHCGSDDSQKEDDDAIPSTEDLIMMMKKKMMMTKKLEMMKCATTEWSLWSDCSASCGTGMRQRSRELVNQNVLPSMCKHDLMQKEQCQGDCLENTPRKQGRDKLNKNFEIRHTLELDLNDPCVVTPWSDWSPCSAKVCGRGVREKWRMFLRKEAQLMNCNVKIMEKDVCYAPIPDCRKAFMMKNFTAICSLPKNDGPCRGNFQRWYYHSSMRKCLPFRYGGCRGNANKFETERECQQQCAEYMENIDSTLNNMNKAELTQPSDMELKRMMRKKQMMANNRKQNNIPQLNDENKESVDFVMRKKRKMMQKEKRKMMKKQRKMEKAKMRERRRQMKEKKRRMRMKNGGNGNGNDGGPKIDCMVTPWTSWEPCTATCGKQYITRTRMVKVEPRNGGKKCPKKLTRRRKCKGLPKCSRDCKVNEWGAWSTCSATCGTNAVRERVRGVMVKPKWDGMECPSLQERQSCNLPSCSGSKEMKEFMDAMQKAPPS